MQKKEYVLKTKEVAEILNVSDQTVRNYCEKFGLPFMKLPSGHKRFSKDDILAFKNKFNEVEGTTDKVIQLIPAKSGSRSAAEKRLKDFEITGLLADSVEF